MHLDLLSRIALTVASSRHEGETLIEIVTGLVDEADFALARIWLITPDAEADGEYLKLRASAGRSAVGRKEEWTNLEGRFSRFELGQRKIGQVGSTGEPVIIENLGKRPEWVAEPEFVIREGMVSFAAHPLVYQERIIGVLGVFSRRPMSRKQLAGR